jgi:hypothetical protein
MHRRRAKEGAGQDPCAQNFENSTGQLQRLLGGALVAKLREFFAPLQVAAVIVVLAAVLFTLGIAISTRSAIKHYATSASLIANTVPQYNDRLLTSISGRTRSPARVVLFIDGVPVDEHVNSQPSPATSTSFSNSEVTCADKCSFRVSMPDQVPGAVRRNRIVALSAQMLEHPAWGNSRSCYQPTTGHPTGDNSVDCDRPPKQSIPPALPSTDGEAIPVPRAAHSTRVPSDLRISTLIRFPQNPAVLARPLNVTVSTSLRVGSWNPQRRAARKEANPASRVVHIWVSPYSLRYSALIRLPTSATLVQALHSGLSQSIFLRKVLDITVDAYVRLASLNPRMQLFENSGSRQTLIVVNGDTSASFFDQDENLAIEEPESPWLSYPASIRKRAHGPTPDCEATANGGEARLGGGRRISGGSAAGGCNQTLVLTVSGFSVTDYAVLDNNSEGRGTQLPSTFWPNGTAVWYGSLSSGHTYHLTLARDTPKTVTDIREILRQAPPLPWSAWNLPVGVLQLLILAALILGLFFVLRSGDEANGVAALLGVLLADTCINLLARISFQLGALLFLHGSAPGVPLPHPWPWAFYGATMACAVGAVVFLGTYSFDRFKVPGARKPFVFTIVASGVVVVTATCLSFTASPSLFTISASPTMLLVLRGSCNALAFALLLIQFRPDVFITLLTRRRILRFGLLTASLLFFSICAIVISPTVLPDNLHPIGLYSPLFITVDVSLFAKSLAPLLFAITMVLPGVSNPKGHPWENRERRLALFLTVLFVGYSYVFIGIPMGLIFSFLAIRFIAIRSEQIHEIDAAVAYRDENVVAPSDIVSLKDIRRAASAQLALRDSFLNNQISGATYERRSADLEAFGKSLARALGPSAAYEKWILGYEFGPGRSLLENGRWGAIVGLAAGVTMALFQSHVILTTFSDGHMVIFDSFAVLALTMLRAVPAGFALGFTLPYLRGNMASTKGLVVAFALCIALLPYDFFQYSAYEALSESLHLLLLFGVIGLALDLLTAIRLARSLPLRQLLDVTGLGNLTATAAVTASIMVSLITQESRALLDVAVQNATVALHSAIGAPTQTEER